MSKDVVQLQIKKSKLFLSEPLVRSIFVVITVLPFLTQ